MAKDEWLNVASLRGTPYRKPQEFFEHLAEFEFMKQSMANAQARLGVASVDQFVAASDEVNARVTKTAAVATQHFGWTHNKVHTASPRDFAFHLATVAAAYRRCTVLCRHSRQTSPRPIEAWLSLNLMACSDCVARIVRLPDVIDDGRCDLCDEPETIFLEAIHQVGHLTVYMNICRSCSGFAGFKAKSPKPPQPPKRKLRAARRRKRR